MACDIRVFPIYIIPHTAFYTSRGQKFRHFEQILVFLHKKTETPKRNTIKPSHLRLDFGDRLGVFCKNRHALFSQNAIPFFVQIIQITGERLLFYHKTNRLSICRLHKPTTAFGGFIQISFQQPQKTAKSASV